MDDALPPLPDSFQERFEKIVPDPRLAGCLESFSCQKPTAFRVNTLKASIKQIESELEAAAFRLSAVPWYEGAFTVDHEQRRALTESAAFNKGRIYIQSLSSMVAPLILSPEPGQTVLDLTAAPGGKTLQMAAMMQGEGRLIAVDVVKGRYYRLKANLVRGGADWVEAYRMDGRAAGRRWPERFERILLDAPCSSEARFSRLNPKSWSHWSTRKVKECAHKQRGLLRAAIQALRPGGTLLYCTCSFSPEENEYVIQSQLRTFGDSLVIDPIAFPLDGLGKVETGLSQWGSREFHPYLSRSIRILPDDQVDGFFLCKMSKRIGGEGR